MVHPKVWADLSQDYRDIGFDLVVAYALLSLADSRRGPGRLRAGRRMLTAHLSRAEVVAWMLTRAWISPSGADLHSAFVRAATRFVSHKIRLCSELDLLRSAAPLDHLV